MTEENTIKNFISSLTKEQRWHGNHNENSNQVYLIAGRLSMIYEKGNLRYISAGNNELIRMIYSAVRIEGWLTVSPVITEEKIEKYQDSFLITYQCFYKMGEAEFRANFRIEGKSDSTLIFSFDGEALSAFRKNRIGLCLLHPLEECCGKNCIITHADNSTETLQFPARIVAHQPFVDIKGMKWKVLGTDCSVSFSGDIFETEDQRNWTDASFKTYSTPLNIPYPVTIKKGDTVSQSIEFKVTSDQKNEQLNSEFINLSLLPDQKSDMPRIGIGRSTRPEPITGNEVGVLKNIPFDHYRADLYLFEPEWKTTAHKSINEAIRLDYALEFALIFDENAIMQINDFIDLLKEYQTRIALFTIYHKTSKSTPDELTDTIAPLLKSAFPKVKICCGTNANFAQLNRSRPESIHNDYICYSIHPQEHASDNLTLIENIQAQSHSVESAKAFSGGKELWISPINIQRRFNANSENFEKALSTENFPPQADSRMMSLFGACWTAGSLKYMLESGIQGLTFYETVGERGIFQGDFDSRWLDEFHSVKGMLFPLYHVFRYLLMNKDFRIIKSKSSNPLKVDILSISDGLNLKTIIINFTEDVKKVKPQWNIENKMMIQLNSDTYFDAAYNKNWIETANRFKLTPESIITLAPFSVSFIE